jgi:hypothetical protein
MYSATQKISHLLWNPNDHYHVHKSQLRYILNDTSCGKWPRPKQFFDSFPEKEFVKPSMIIMEQQKHILRGITECTNRTVMISTHIQKVFNLNTVKVTNYPDRDFVGFLSPSRKMPDRIVPRLGHGCFLPNSFQFIFILILPLHAI